MSSDDPSDYDEMGADGILEALEEELDFEQKFFEAVCETSNFEVISIPDEKGYTLNKEERNLLEKAAARQGIKILYRVSHNNFATVFDPQTGKVGIIPENNSRGFAC
jgi:hypothetical protein